MVELSPKDIKVRVKVRPKGKIVQDAWKHSRPNDTPQPWDVVAKIDVPVNEMEDFVLELFVPIIIREIIFTMRDHVAWARTSRVDNLNDWPIQRDVLENMRPELKALALEMKTQMMTKDQDDFRMLLPLAYMTHFTLKISARSLVKLAQLFGEMSWSGYDRTVANIFEDVHDALMGALIGTPYYDVAAEKKYQKISLISNEWEPFHFSEAKVLGGVMVARIKAVPIALRAQLVRHRPLSIRDSLHNYFRTPDLALPIKSPVDIELAMTVQQGIELVKKRNCWISQDDLWRPVLDTINSALGRQDASPVLPCNDCNKCPIERDNVLRHEGKDPAPPCPIWLKFGGMTFANTQSTEAAFRFAERRGNSKWWNNQILEAM